MLSDSAVDPTALLAAHALLDQNAAGRPGGAANHAGGILAFVASLADRILELLGTGGELDDDELAARLGVIRQHVNQVSRRLERQGLIVRQQGWRGKIVNRRTNAPAPEPRPPRSASTGDLITEDEVKQAMKEHLEVKGYRVDVRWGKERGIDIVADGPDGRLIIEAKGDAPTPQMQGNYFLGALGELLQRMSDPDATYGIALPDNS